MSPDCDEAVRRAGHRELDRPDIADRRRAALGGRHGDDGRDVDCAEALAVRE
jgi:hypothetical protein